MLALARDANHRDPVVVGFQPHSPTPSAVLSALLLRRRRHARHPVPQGPRTTTILQNHRRRPRLRRQVSRNSPDRSIPSGTDRRSATFSTTLLLVWPMPIQYSRLFTCFGDKSIFHDTTGSPPYSPLRISSKYTFQYSPAPPSHYDHADAYASSIPAPRLRLACGSRSPATVLIADATRDDNIPDGRQRPSPRASRRDRGSASGTFAPVASSTPR